MIRLLLMACLFAELLLPAIGDAFDGSRKGFFLSVGVGPGTFKTEKLRGWSEKGSATSSVISFGAGSSERVLVYFTTYVDMALDSETDLLGNSGISARYYLRSTAPSFYLSGTLGYERFEAREPGTYRCSWGENGICHYTAEVSETGPGASLAIGYEFLKNWDLEASGVIGSESAYDFKVLRLLISHSWY